MSGRGFGRLVVTQATILRRNTSFWLASLVVAVVSIAVFGWLVNPGAARPFDLALVDEDGTQTSVALAAAFDEMDSVNVKARGREEAMASLKDGDFAAVVVVPPGFGAGVARGDASLSATYDDSQDPTSTAYVRSSVGGLIAAFGESAGARPGITVEEASVSTNSIRYIDFLIPGMIGMTMMYVNLGVGFLLVGWREQGILRRLGVTPLRPAQLIVSQAASFGLISLAKVAIILAIGHAVFDVDVHGGIPWLALTVALGVMAMLAIGYMLASVLNTTTSVTAMVNLVAFPMLFLGRSYFPLDPPASLAPLVQVLPLTHLNDALRIVVNRDGSVGDMWVHWVALAAWAVVGFVASARMFRWQ